MMKKILIVFALTVTALLLMPAAGRKAYASSGCCPNCGSYDIYEDGTDYKEYSASRHTVETIYKCIDCSHEWTDTGEYENHQWEYMEDDDDNYKYISSSKHEVRRHYDCECCDAAKTKTVEEKHNYGNGGSVCLYCSYPRKDQTLQSGKWTYYSGRPWLKIQVKRDGYLDVKGFYSYLDLYKKSKKPYQNVFASSHYSDNTIPVKKGTYYLRPSSWSSDNSKLKVTFNALKNERNYTKRKAAAVPRNKYKKAAIYTNDKKKTWRRWYKIRIAKNRRIYTWGDISYLIDSKGRSYDLRNCGNGKSVSEKKLKKGTYYFSVEYYWEGKERQRDTGRYYRFKWNYK